MFLHKLQTIFLIGLLLLMSAGCASIYRADVMQLNVLRLSDVDNEPAMWEEVGKKIQGGNDVVLFIQKGQAVPIDMNVALPMATLQPGANRLVFTRDTYLLVSNSHMRISPDGIRWADLSDLKTQNALFGYNGGALSVGLHSTKEEGTCFTLDVLNK